MSEESIPRDYLEKHFECQRCGCCCRLHGTVAVSEAEVCAIAEFLQLEVSDFTDRFTTLLPNRSGLSLSERANGDCIFYSEDGFGCQIHPVKPRQCRDFPFTWRYADWEKVCAGARKLRKFFLERTSGGVFSPLDEDDINKNNP